MLATPIGGSSIAVPSAPKLKTTQGPPYEALRSWQVTGHHRRMQSNERFMEVHDQRGNISCSDRRTGKFCISKVDFEAV
jgi:hypothetical protein